MTIQKTSNNHQKNKDEEINLIDLSMKIWAERRIIYKTILVFLTLGLIVALTEKKEYRSNISFILEDSRGGSRMSGLLSQFGGLTGLNVNAGDVEGVVSPQLYKDVVKSVPFILEILYSEIEIEKFDTVATVFDYFNELEKPSLLGVIKDFTIGLPWKIIEWAKGEDEFSSMLNNENDYSNTEIIKLSEEEEEIIDNLIDRIQLRLDDKTGIIYLTVEMPDAVAAAQLTWIIFQKLMNYLIDYKIEKAQIDYNFIYERYEEALKKYIKAQNNLARFRDENQNVAKALVLTEEERLQNEYRLSFDVYNGLAQQLEQKKIEVQEKTPIFKVVDMVKIPIEKNKPRRTLILFIFIFTGFIFSLFIIFVKYIKS